MPRKIVKSLIILEGDEVETLAEVPEREPIPWGPEAALEVVGKPLHRINGYDVVSGSARYTSDVVLPNMAHAATLRCPYPHARITRIDTSAAERLPGVLGVITHGNTPKIPWYSGTTSLFDTTLRYEGDEVACVAAETAAIAEAIGWQQRNRPAGSGAGLRKRGIGMAGQIRWGGGGPPAYATVKLNGDGSARVLAGTQDLGTGTYTFMAQVAAEVLEIPVERVQVTLGDTAACPVYVLWIKWRGEGYC